MNFVQTQDGLHLYKSGHQTNLLTYIFHLYHTLSIWLEMEFKSGTFFKHQFALIIQKLFLKTNKINIYITK